MSMRRGRAVGDVLSFATQVASTVGLSAPNIISDINIEFFESMLEKISDFKNDATSDHKHRWNFLLQSLSRLIGSSLGYISTRHLCKFDPNILYSLLEIINLLAQNTIIQENFRTAEYIHNKRLNPDELCGNVSCKLENVRNSYSQQNSLPILLHESQNNFETRSHDNMESKLQNMDRTTESSVARLAYLQEKLKTFLPSIPIDGNNPKSGGVFILTRSNSFRTEQLKRPSNNCHCDCKSVVKLHAKPLVDPLHIYSNKHSTIPCPISSTEENEVLSNQSFYKLLNGFPKLDLDEHEERVLRKKALSLMRQLSSNPSSGLSPTHVPESHSQCIEERQRRRLAQLVHYDRQIENLRQQRANETVERRIRGEAREKKFQLIRARKYFDEFVREFRLKKIAKVNTDEKIFRQFFQQLIQKQKEYFLEVKKLEREENLQKEEQKKKIMESLEHEHRIRLELMNEKINKEREEQSIRVREEQKVLRENKRKLRHQLEMNLREMQEAFLNNGDSAHFREQDAKMLLASNNNFLCDIK
uniref:Centrosomal protein of 95 kDa n=1 Tax=Schistosoma mansoni TaxID=6183 RepID=A0A5K4FBE3_SCHMA